MVTNSKSTPTCLFWHGGGPSATKMKALGQHQKPAALGEQAGADLFIYNLAQFISLASPAEPRGEKTIFVHIWAVKNF